MKLKYSQSKGGRIKRGFCGFTTFDEPEPGCWWVYDLTAGCWVGNVSKRHESHSFSSHAPCNSVRAFRRMLKKAPEGVQFVLCSFWKRNDVIGYGQKRNNCKKRK